MAPPCFQGCQCACNRCKITHSFVCFEIDTRANDSLPPDVKRKSLFLFPAFDGFKSVESWIQSRFSDTVRVDLVTR